MKKNLLFLCASLSLSALGMNDQQDFSIKCSDGELRKNATILKRCKTLAPLIDVYPKDPDFDLTFVSHHADKETVGLLFNALENRPLPNVHPQQAEKLLRLADDMAVSRKDILKIAKRYENDLVLEDKPEISWLLKISKEIPHKYLAYKMRGGTKPLFENMLGIGYADLSKLNIKSFDGIGSYLNRRKVLALNVQHNKMDAIDYQEVKKTFPNLQVMVANDEQLDQMPLNYREDIRSRVKECEIDLSDLNLTNLEGLEKISQKHCEVRRWFSFLADSPPKGSVTKLNISNNKLTQLNTALIKKAFPYIKKISADNNQVKELKFKDLTDLSCDSYVSLKNNQIISINFNGPTGLFNPEGCTVDISGSYLAQEEIELVRTKLFTNGTSLQLIPKKISSIWSNSVLQLWACITPIMGLVSIASPIKHPSGCDIENANLFNMLLSMSKYGNGYQKAFAGLGYLGIFYGVVGYAQFFSPVCNRVFNRPFVQSTLVAENQYPARQLLTKWAQRKSDGLVCLLDKKLDPALE